MLLTTYGILWRGIMVQSIKNTPSARAISAKSGQLRQSLSRFFRTGSLAILALPMMSFWLSYDNIAWCAFPLLFVFVGLPLLDRILGRDTSEPQVDPEAEEENSGFYRSIALLAAICVIPLMLGVAFLAHRPDMPLWAALLFAFGTGPYVAMTVNAAHELGHAPHRLDRAVARFNLAFAGQVHFTTDHNLCHHSEAATPADCASARYGETIYAFWLRETPGILARAWGVEARRLAKQNRPALHWRNRFLQDWAIGLGAIIGLSLALGGPVIVALLVSLAGTWWCVSTTSYIAHYGLCRKTLPNGRVEPFNVQHAWNDCHRVSALTAFNVMRHSDHHMRPQRPYQNLSPRLEAPHLPTSLAGCFILASSPGAWFKIMNPKVLQAAGHDPDRVNWNHPDLRTAWFEGRDSVSGTGLEMPSPANAATLIAHNERAA